MFSFFGLSRINRKIPHSFLLVNGRYLDFWLVPYIICRLWDHFSQTFITHLSCKFSSFSYSPSLLQQFTTFGISAASFINSYKHSAGKLQLYSSLHPVQRTLNSTGAYNYNGKRFQTIAILPKSVSLHKKKDAINIRWKYRYLALTLKSTSMPSNRLESSGNWLRISSEPMKILSKWDQVLCTSNQIEITESDTDSFFCHKETSSKKCPMYLDVIRFWSCTWEKEILILDSSCTGNRERWTLIVIFLSVKQTYPMKGVNQRTCNLLSRGCFEAVWASKCQSTGKPTKGRHVYPESIQRNDEF